MSRIYCHSVFLSSSSFPPAFFFFHVLLLPLGHNWPSVKFDPNIRLQRTSSCPDWTVLINCSPINTIANVRRTGCVCARFLFPALDFRSSPLPLMEPLICPFLMPISFLHSSIHSVLHRFSVLFSSRYQSSSLTPHNLYSCFYSAQFLSYRFPSFNKYSVLSFSVHFLVFIVCLFSVLSYKKNLSTFIFYS